MLATTRSACSQGEATGPNFSQGQVHQKAQVSQVTVLFPDGVPPGDIIKFRDFEFRVLSWVSFRHSEKKKSEQRLLNVF